MATLNGIEYLRDKLVMKRTRVLMRYKYYDMKNWLSNPGPIIPANLSNSFKACLGWCANAVDSLADRLIFREFQSDDADIQSIFNNNNPDTLFDSAVLSALISACCFVYICKDETGAVRLQVIDGGNATGIINPVTGLLTEGYAVLERDDQLNVVTEAYFAPGRTEIYSGGNKPVQVISTGVNYPMLVPIIYRPDASRPFGHSRISRACMNLQDKAARTLVRADVTAEFYSWPQKYVLGTSTEAEPLDQWRATIASILEFTKDEDGNHPVIGQFQQQSMTPHIEQFKMYASAFGGETGLTLDDLGFVTDNPSSAEAIKAAHEKLRLTARKAQRTLGSGFLNTGLLAASLRDSKTYPRATISNTVPVWEPIFEPDAAMLSGIGDGAIKLNQAVPGYFDKTNLRNLTGISPSE